MRMRCITISGLFGMFDHRIPLFQGDGITIIHGPNGIGKTSILRLIYGSLKPDYSHLRQVPFKHVEIEFEDGTSLNVSARSGEQTEQPSTRHSQRNRLRRQYFDFSLKKNDRPMHEFKATAGRPTPSERNQVMTSHFLPFLHRVGEWEWHDSRTEEMLSWEEVMHRYGDHLPDDLRTQGEPAWLSELRQQVPVHFIETQRLLDVRPYDPGRTRAEPRGAKVNACADEFANSLKSKLAESARLSQSLERTFPLRLISEEGPSPLSEPEIRKSLTKLDERRNRLVEAGLLDHGSEPYLPGKRFDETTKRALTVYIQDNEKKLDIFDDFLSRIELMKSIIDSRFLYKSLKIDREKGLVVLTRDNRVIALSDLSSGEQHELVLLYELLFKARPNTLILIDEPELSLHIAWQQQFLRDLVNITRLAKLQALIATHSPQIIHDRWDLTVELSGPAH